MSTGSLTWMNHRWSIIRRSDSQVVVTKGEFPFWKSGKVGPMHFLFIAGVPGTGTDSRINQNHIALHSWGDIFFWGTINEQISLVTPSSNVVLSSRC